MWRRDFLIPHDGIRKLIDDIFPIAICEDAQASGSYRHHRYRLRRQRGAVRRVGRARRSWPRPRSPALSRRSDTRISIWPMARSPATRRSGWRSQKARRRLIILPTGYACATNAPPVGAVANALHALTLLIARQLVSELENLGARHRVFRGAAFMPAGRLALRFLADRRSYRAGGREHRCLAGARRPRAAAGSRTRCGRTAIEHGPASDCRNLRCTAKGRG